jgi:hypothetical protein
MVAAGMMGAGAAEAFTMSVVFCASLRDLRLLRNAVTGHSVMAGGASSCFLHPSAYF